MRYLSELIKKDLTRKMVFLAGPRQVGKTTLAKELCQDGDIFLNWDIPSDRDLILRRTLPSSGLLVIDEIHMSRYQT
jgi:predicted AAA+ superfamily ATPase